MGKMSDLPSNPTNADLADRLGQVHECVDAVGDRVGKVEFDLNSLRVRQHRMLVAFGLEDAHDGEAIPTKPGRRRSKPVALMSQWEAAWKGVLTLGSALGGLFLMIKVAVAAVPGAESIAHAIWVVIIH